MKTNQASVGIKITKVEATDEKLSGRGGLFFILRYIESLGFYQIFENIYGHLKKSSKGLSCLQFIKQVLAFFIDGSDLSMKSFDRRQDDAAYAALLENTPEQMASSHQIKRFFQKFAFIGNRLFRNLLLRLFIWRLHIEQPELIVLFADSMVLGNDDATRREGVEPTYKNKKGFQPLQISWGPYLVDAVFRAGSTHCNRGYDLMKAVGRLVSAIRKEYRDVPIILVTDSGQLNLEFTRTDSFIYTNIGQDQQLTDQLIAAGAEDYLRAERAIHLNHQRGKGELNHRALKEFATKEQLPFEKFGMNQAYYYIMMIAYFLYEAYKHDVTAAVFSLSSYPTTFRRQVIDFAVKIISTGGKYIIKVAHLIYERLDIQNVWELSGAPPHPLAAR